VEGKVERQRKQMKLDKSPTLALEVAALDAALATLSEGTPIYRSSCRRSTATPCGPWFLLTNKPVLVVLNVGEDQLGDADKIATPVAEAFGDGAEILPMCVQLEAEAAQLPVEERQELLDAYELGEGAVSRLIRSAYRILGRRTYFTTGPDETRAWTFRAGAKAPEVRRRDPHRLPAGVHQGRVRALGRAARARLLVQGARRREAADRGQGVRGGRRGRPRVPLQCLIPRAERPMLVLVGTPIGNLEDLAPRAVRTLAEADLVLCEDTRRTGRLLQAAGIRAKQLLAAHDHNEVAQIGGVIDRLRAGETVAVVSDAGMPGISDPGERMVRAVAEAGFEVQVVPGPSAAVTGLVASGLPTGRFVFEGFLPRSGSGRTERLAALAGERRTIVLYEAPHRLARTMADLAAALGGARRVALARELTKLHEETWRGTLEAAVARCDEVEPRGEYVVVVDGSDEPPPAGDEELLAAVRRQVDEGSSTRDAVAEVAATFGVPKRRGVRPGHDQAIVVDPLANAVWSALTTAHAGFAEVHGLARRYPVDVSPFAGVEELDPASWAALAAQAGPGGAVTLFREGALAPPPGWTVLLGGVGHQMVLERAPDGALVAEEATLLGPADVPEMLALVEIAQPGPFRERTVELGDYWGVRDEAGTLVAMAGERMHLDGWTEISAVCTLPQARGEAWPRR
jgi:16S rRNA (cytidine1402-2'-O)-methyltransferase